MRALLAAAALFAGCATVPAPKLETTVANPPPPPPPTCPTALGPFVETGEVLGLVVEKVCLVGASEDSYLRLHERVAPREDEPLAADAVSLDLQELYASGTLLDVVAVAQVLPSKKLLLTYFVTEAEWISDVQVQGASAGHADHLGALAREGLHATPFVLKAVAAQVQAYFAGLGYAKATVDATAKSLGAGKATLTLAVTEGPRLTVGAILFEGPRKVPEAELRKAVQVTLKSPYLDDVVERDALLLTSAYFDRGFINVNVEREARPAPGDTVQVVFKVTEGDQYRLGKLAVGGFSIGDEKDVLKVLESKPKAVFSRAMLQRDMDRLRERARQRGNAVEVTPITTLDQDKKTVDVKFELERKAGSSVSF